MYVSDVAHVSGGSVVVGGGTCVSIDRKDRLVGGSQAPLICITTSRKCEYGTRRDSYGGSCEQSAPWNDAELLASHHVRLEAT